MEEKKYLKWYNKIGYGSGDIAGNVVYAFLTSFMMVYLTDSVTKHTVKWEKRNPGCYTDTLVVPLRWSAALQYQSALEQRLNMHGSLFLIHC